MSLQFSFSELPPILAAVHGLGTEPFLLYKSIAFDSLHAIDLGILRLFTETCFQHFGAKVNFTTIPTSQCIAVANSRLRLVPRGVHLSKVSLFLGKTTDQLAAITGLIRRQSCPFLWTFVLGLNTKLTPDCDPLFQAVLELNDIHCKLLGVNEDLYSMHRTEVWIHKLQQQFFNLGTTLTQLFHRPVNTKLHRVMRHIEDHLLSFGTLRWGATDKNETQHKHLTLDYRSTNRRPDSLAVQLLKNGYADDLDIDEYDQQNIVTLSATSTSTPHVSVSITTSIQELNTSRSFSRRIDKTLSLKYSRNKHLVWSVLTHNTLQNKIPWALDSVRQYTRQTYTYRP